MLVYIKCRQQQLTHTHRQAGRQASLVQFSWPPIEGRQGEARNMGARKGACPTSHWVESESLESRLACVGVGLQL